MADVWRRKIKVGEVLDFTHDFSLWLASGDTVSTSTWASSVAGPLLVGDGANGAPVDTNSTTATTVWLLGVAAGETVVTNTMTSTDSRIKLVQLVVTVVAI